MEQSVKNKELSVLNVRLTNAMQGKGLTLNSLSQQAGIAIGTIQKLMNDPHCNPTINSLEAICKVLNIPISYLVDQGQLAKTNIPLLDWNTLAEDLPEINSETGKRPSIQAYCTLSEAAFALKMQGSSMTPAFPIDTILIFDKNKSYYDGCFVLVYEDQSTQFLFRRLLIDGTNFYVKSLNPELKDNQPILIKPEQIIATLAQAQM